MDNFDKCSTTHAKFAMRTAWVQGGRAPPCIQGEVMANFAWVVDLLAKLSMRATAVHANDHARHAQHNSATGPRTPCHVTNRSVVCYVVFFFLGGPSFELTFK
jgi:hypothetical protein